MRQKVITKIEANPLLVKQNDANAILRVAAYCRVSTDSEDQLESYAAQVSYYTDIIGKNPRWRFVKIYADEGITGTLAKKRKHFRFDPDKICREICPKCRGQPAVCAAAESDGDRRLFSGAEFRYPQNGK